MTDRSEAVAALAEALHAVDDDLHFIRRDARNFPVLAARILAALRPEREEAGLREHEAALVAFGRFMVNADPKNPANVDYAEMGRLAAEVINGIPAVRAALGAAPSCADCGGDHPSGHRHTPPVGTVPAERTGAAPGAGLDAAWAAVEAALPEGQHLCDLVHDDAGWENGPRLAEWTAATRADDHDEWGVRATAGTPVAALNALAERLEARDGD